MIIWQVATEGSNPRGAVSGRNKSHSKMSHEDPLRVQSCNFDCHISVPINPDCLVANAV